MAAADKGVLTNRDGIGVPGRAIPLRNTADTNPDRGRNRTFLHFPTRACFAPPSREIVMGICPYSVYPLVSRMVKPELPGKIGKIRAARFVVHK